MDSPRNLRPLAGASALAQDLRSLLSKLKRRLREQASAPGDLTPSQVSVLLRLEKEGCMTSAALARAEGMRPQSMGAVIAALEIAGWIGGASDPNDGRQTLLSLTDACRRWAREGRSARQDWLTDLIQARLSSHEQAQIAASINLLRRLVDD